MKPLLSGLCNTSQVVVAFGRLQVVRGGRLEDEFVELLLILHYESGVGACPVPHLRKNISFQSSSM